jgi:hypothetical protein
MKRALRKYSLQIVHVSDWDLQLPWLVMGYRFSKQASLASFSPYMLLFGREPELPRAICRKVSGVVQFDNPDVWIQVCSERDELFQKVMPMAFQNLAIAQHLIHCGMQSSKEADIGLALEGSLLVILCTCNRLRLILWM